jgi:hypothetical protein
LLRKLVVWIAACTALGVPVALLLTKRSPPKDVVFLRGAVLRDDADPNRHLPIANAEIAADGLQDSRVVSDPSGFFRLRLRPGVRPGQVVNLTFRHPEYHPLDMKQSAGDRIYVVRMEPLKRELAAKLDRPPVTVSNVRVRYALKTTTTVNVGSAARTFQIVNTGNVPCDGESPCSPDGKWKAAINSITIDAGDRNEFRNVRVSCIAGPCPFTNIESDRFLRGGRQITVSARNWSDTATFLVEAEVTHTMAGETIRRSYPVKFGQAMNFTLPSTAQGPSIEAEIDGAEIVFPLGPNLILSWANCSLELAPDHSRQYRCELKPGYHFK